MQSIQNVLTRLFLKVTLRKKSLDTAPVKSVRKSLEKLTRLALPARGVKTEAIEYEGLKMEWSVPNKLQKKEAVILYFHGGGYISGSIKTHRALTGNLATAANACCLSVEYSLAPEAPFPEGLNDAMKAYNWLLDQGFDNKKIVIGGDSAGGGLAVATLLKIRDQQLPTPAAGILLSPWLDLACKSESHVSLAKKDAMLTKNVLVAYGQLYAKNDINNPYASPSNADVKGLPPICIHVSDAEILLDDSLIFAEKLKEQNIEHELKIYKNTLHVWQAYGVILPEAKRSLKEFGQFIKSKTT